MNDSHLNILYSIYRRDSSDLQLHIAAGSVEQHGEGELLKALIV